MPGPEWVSLQSLGIQRTEFDAPQTSRLSDDNDAAFRQHEFDISMD